MVSSTFLRLLILCTQPVLQIIITININFTHAQLQPPAIPLAVCDCDNTNGNYTTNSTYQKNLNDLLSSLLSNNNGYGFYNSSLRQNTDTVYGIGLCRGDLKSDACGKCLSDATYALPKNCSNQKEAIGWYENCMLRYANRSMYGLLEVNPAYSASNTENVLSTYLDAFNQEITALFKGLGSKAAGSGDLRKFAVGNASVGANADLTIYGLAQCTPDVSEGECATCIDGALGVVQSCCSGTIGVRVVKPSCNIRYEIMPFFDSTNETPLPSPPLARPASAPPPPSADATTPGGIVYVMCPILMMHS